MPRRTRSCGSRPISAPAATTAGTGTISCEKDSGLPSNFLNQVKAVDGSHAWFSTDKGLAYFDGANWAVYRTSPGQPQAGNAWCATPRARSHGSKRRRRRRTITCSAWTSRETTSGWPPPTA